MNRAIKIIIAVILFTQTASWGSQIVKAQEIIQENTTIYLPLVVKPGPNIPTCTDCRVWPSGIATVSIPSSVYIGYSENARFYSPANASGTNRVPLLVGLHTWSTDWNSEFFGAPYAHWAKANNWAFIFPDFRGSNATLTEGNRGKPMGSDMVYKAILDAVAYAQSHSFIDPNRIYLMGESGGGHVALLMAGRAPAVFAGVSAWASITNLQQWYYESQVRGKVYDDQIAYHCSGEPVPGSQAGDCAILRSPVLYLSETSNVPVDINAGINDGHGTLAVPIQHSLYAWNQVAPQGFDFSDDEIATMNGTYSPVDVTGTIPDPLQFTGNDLLYSNAGKPVLMRREYNGSRITIFNGGHEAVYWAGLTWLYYQSR